MMFKKDEMIAALSALAHGPRLDVFRYLVRHEPEGAFAGAIAEALHMRNNTLSANLNVLSSAGLVSGERQGRNIVYRADLETMRRLIAYLLEDCCGSGKCIPMLESVLCEVENSALCSDRDI